MDVFCPHCLHSVTLESRAPGEYTFDCPECSAETHVTVPAQPGQRPIVCPVRSEQSTSRLQAARSRRSDSRATDRRGNGDPNEIDFPFEESDQNLIESAQKPLHDEWDLVESEIPQPLRGAAIKKPAESRPRRRTQTPEPDFATYLKWMGIGVGVWVLLIAAGVWVRELAWLSVGAGILVLLTTRRMILRVARNEGASIWLACLLVPFYSVFFSLAHFRKTANALLMAFFGYGYLISGFLLFEVHDFVDAMNAAVPAAVAPDDEDADDEFQKEAAAKIGFDNVTLTIDGRQVRLPVSQLTCFEAGPGRAGGDAAFEFAGPDISLRGTFPPGFQNEWVKLLGTDVPILPRSDRPGPGESHIKVPGRGIVRVTGGKFSLRGAMTAGQPALFGEIELEIAGEKKPETVRGSFSVKVKEAG